MAVQWAGLGPELLLRLDPDSGKPLRAHLETALRETIRSGRLRGGERLPSSRELAGELGVSRGLVQECYNQLLAAGDLSSRVGSAAGGAPPPAWSRSPTTSCWPRGTCPAGSVRRPGLRPVPARLRPAHRRGRSRC